MKWPWQTKALREEAERAQKLAEQQEREALAAKISADVELAAARQTRHEVGLQVKKLQDIKAKNGFSESLTKAFKGSHA